MPDSLRSVADPAVSWLLASKDPSVRYLALTEVVGASPRSAEVRQLRERIPQGPRVRALLRGQKGDGGFGVHPYLKWTGAHWRLVSLAELGIPSDHQGARAAARTALDWLEQKRRPRQVGGLYREHASQEGNALAYCSRLGMARDARVQRLAAKLLEWQWPDGGWNCDERAEAGHSSFYESLSTMWGLIEYHRATGDRDAQGAVDRAAEFFLEHRMFRSSSTGEVINARWTKLHYPLYWHYDILQGMLIISRWGRAGDERAAEALDIVESKRRKDGLWQAGAYYWNPPVKDRGGPGTKKAQSNLEVVDWGRGAPHEMITLNALRVLKAAGRLS